ncbi:hypothetical protein Thivi_1594 [Thiocystis violascens DSM 198]|uniref:Uncharacterized protein n=1 Tax=Thiocystis violascens (strain ATCC 17096 / DSM 198 / 6111) TaxID=765911 RepID=I3Y9B3_THIV6|nr:hypothetical protein Thivi_1594 [Thiocystis violascens DSM 198]
MFDGNIGGNNTTTGKRGLLLRHARAIDDPSAGASVMATRPESDCFAGDRLLDEEAPDGLPSFGSGFAGLGSVVIHESVGSFLEEPIIIVSAR